MKGNSLLRRLTKVPHEPKPSPEGIRHRLIYNNGDCDICFYTPQEYK